MCRRNSGQSRRKRRICSRILVCSPALRSTTIEEGTVMPPTTRDKLALSGVADRNCRCHSLLQCVRPITWFDLGVGIISGTALYQNRVQDDPQHFIALGRRESSLRQSYA